MCNRCTGGKDEDDYRPLFENFVQDLLSTLNLPEWPASEAVLTLLARLLVGGGCMVEDGGGCMVGSGGWWVVVGSGWVVVGGGWISVCVVCCVSVCVVCEMTNSYTYMYRYKVHVVH